MGVIKLNGKEYGGGGGGGNANIVELTQAEYDALPESKLTDGILYCITDGDGDVINFVNGVYIDTSNVVCDTFTFDSTEHTWTATADCILTDNLIPLDSSTACYIKIDGKQVSASYVLIDPFVYVRKGQVVAYRAKSGSSMKAYGVQTGSVSNAQHNYSTSEQVIGTWVDGKPLYEKTFNATLNNIASGVATNVEDVSGLNIDEIANISGRVNYYNGADWFYVNLGTYFGAYIYTNAYLQFLQTMTGQTTNRIYKIAITVQYTKTTD